jgi:Mn-dependent DtxR family transcriptional regulator
MLLFCTPRSQASSSPQLVVKGLIDRDTAGALTLTDRGRAVLQATYEGYVMR